MVLRKCSSNSTSLAVCILLLIFFASCSAQDSTHSLQSKKQFKEFCGPPLTNKYGELTAVKVVYSLKTEDTYYLNHKKFKLHHDFCNYLKGYEIELARFNYLNYGTSEHREYLLGNINYIKSLDIYALELSPTDLMSTNLLADLYKHIVNTSFIGKELKVYLNTSGLLAQKYQLSKLFPVITSADIYQSLHYQSISNYKATRTLRFVKDIKSSRLSPTDIIVLENTPNSIPMVAGILVSEFQTPLSHLTILGGNRKIPICAFKNAYTNEKLRAWDGELVLFEVKNDTFIISKQSKIHTSSKTKSPVQLKASLEEKSLIDV